MRFRFTFFVRPKIKNFFTWREKHIAALIEIYMQKVASHVFCNNVSGYTRIFCTLHSSMAAFFEVDVSSEQMKGL